MKIIQIKSLQERPKADLLVLPFCQKKQGGPFSLFKTSLFQKEIKKIIELGDFRGHLGEIFILHPTRQQEPRLALLGLGVESKACTEDLRKSCAVLTRFSHERGFKSVNVLFPEFKKLSKQESLRGLCEGFFLSSYVFTKLKNTTKKRHPQLKMIRFIGLENEFKPLLKKHASICEGVNLARDLVNENADTLNADKLSEIAFDFQKKFKKISTLVFDKKRLEKENLKLILAVNQGSSANPALIMVNYKGDPADKKATVLVGKGVTYDTGGIQLKAAKGTIVHMKCDMGGAAAVLGVLHAVAQLDLPINIIGVIPACENAISDKAYKPGDVYESYHGNTVEITNTDAEGRLILADALAYAEKNLHPKHLIDLATLTGGVIAALGNKMSGLMSNDSSLAKKLIVSGKKSGELLWKLPLFEDYKVALRSSLADLKNASTGGAYPAAAVAGLFLQEFVQSTPWAHLDIAGTAYLSEPKDYHTTKATGVGVRLVLAFLEDLIDSQGGY
ncbi:MAG: putative cytosol aminopeptidase [Chlamydiae bacterium]|nr:putative cytosol aminopeptidase [Chlamydiota bacterium]